jgi:transcriptional regulator with XRE-family HTH domain
MTFEIFDAKTLAGRVSSLRKHRGLSQAALGKRVGISQSAIAQIETGMSKTIKGNTLLKMAAALEANPRWIMTGNGEPLMLDDPGDFSELLELYESMDDDHKAAIVAAARAFTGK